MTRAFTRLSVLFYRILNLVSGDLLSRGPVMTHDGCVIGSVIARMFCRHAASTRGGSLMTRDH